MTEEQLDTLRAEWVDAAIDSDLGLTWLAADVREVLGLDAAESIVCCATLVALPPLLETGKLRAVTLGGSGGDFDPGTGTVDEQLRRIENEWRQYGKPGFDSLTAFIGHR